MQRSERLIRDQSKPNAREVLQELVRRVERLRPDHRYPHRFHEEKSEIAYEMAELSRTVA
ncbi:MAG TPA: hypothetical protein DIT67_06705 [Octadecabacter sp.]|nr:hypothetical protein [Octadecabacter sp.]